MLFLRLHSAAVDGSFVAVSRLDIIHPVGSSYRRCPSLFWENMLPGAGHLAFLTTS